MKQFGQSIVTVVSWNIFISVMMLGCPGHNHNMLRCRHYVGYAPGQLWSRRHDDTSVAPTHFPSLAAAPQPGGKLDQWEGRMLTGGEEESLSGGWDWREFAVMKAGYSWPARPHQNGCRSCGGLCTWEDSSMKCAAASSRESAVHVSNILDHPIEF